MFVLIAYSRQEMTERLTPYSITIDILQKLMCKKFSSIVDVDARRHLNLEAYHVQTMDTIFLFVFLRLIAYRG